jgi:hypothetical protein
VISLLPSYHETLVLPKPAVEVCQLLAGATSNRPFLQPDETTLYFNGWVNEKRFRISLRVRRANHYLPLVKGKIESSSSGCILFIDYGLFPTIRLLLTLWTILLILGSLVVYYQTKNFFFLLAGLGIIAVIHGIVWSNFKLQLLPTRDAFLRLLT